MATMKTELWWVSVGGAPVEVVRVTLDKNGEHEAWYSIGCGDPHPVDMPGVEWIEQIQDHERPVTRSQEEAERKKRERIWKAAQKIHFGGYRRFE